MITSKNSANANGSGLSAPYVLPAERGGAHFVGIQKPWQRVRGAAGLEDVRIHDLRHSFASIAVSGGDSLCPGGKVLRHRQSRTTERYAHLRDDPLRAVRWQGEAAAALRALGLEPPLGFELP